MSCVNGKFHAGFRASIARDLFGVVVFHHISHELLVFLLIFFVTWRRKPFLQVVHAPDSVISVVRDTFEAFL